MDIGSTDIFDSLNFGNATPEQPFYSHFQGHGGSGASVAGTLQTDAHNSSLCHIDKFDIAAIGLKIGPDLIYNCLNLLFHRNPFSLKSTGTSPDSLSALWSRADQPGLKFKNIWAPGRFQMPGPGGHAEQGEEEPWYKERLSVHRKLAGCKEIGGDGFSGPLYRGQRGVIGQVECSATIE
jgi:hypothetical protein